MARTRRRQPNDLKSVHDRRAADFNMGIARHVAPIEVDDPLETGGKLIVMRSTRNDPLGNLHAKKYIREDQYQAGREYQSFFEIAQGQQQACDPSQPYVDQSFRHRGVSVSLSTAYKQLNRANRELGQSGAAIVLDVLITGLSIAQVGQKREQTSELELKYLGRRFRECLDTLSLVYGFSMPPK